MQYAIDHGLSSTDALVFRSIYNIIIKFRGFKKICLEENPKILLLQLQKRIAGYMKHFIRTENYLKKFRT